MKIVRWIAVAVFACIFAFSAYKFFPEYLAQREAESEFESLASLVGEPDETAEPLGPVPDAERQIGPGLSPILPQYEEVYAKNSDTFGWVRIPDTKIVIKRVRTPSSHKGTCPG